MLKNILCDRDGTIIYDKHYLCDPEGVELLPGAAAGLGALYKSGSRIFVVTNQSGIGRGLYSQDQYAACAFRLDKLLAEAGVRLGGTVFCPHDPDRGAGCACRKPADGLWRELRVKYSLHEAESVMIGDKADDIMFGKNAGLARVILVLTGNGIKTAVSLGLGTEHPDLARCGWYEPAPAGGGIPDCVALDLAQAAAYILHKNGSG